MNIQRKLTLGIIFTSLVAALILVLRTTTAHQHDTVSPNETPDEYNIFFISDTERVSAAVYNCQDANFYFSLTREQITELQHNFDRHSELTTQTIGIPDIPTEHQDLTFDVDREHLQKITREIEDNPNINSALLIKQIPPESITGSQNVPQDQYAVKAFFNSSMTAKIYKSFLNDPSGKYCIIGQPVDFEGKTLGEYYIPFEAIYMMYNLFQTNPDAKSVGYDAVLQLITKTPNVI